MKNFFLAALLAAFSASTLCAQAPNSDAQPSLADVARQTRENRAKAKAKVVVTDETLAASKGPIPEISFNAQENSKDIVRAIEFYRKSHTPQETEAAIKNWFESEDGQLDQAITANQQYQDGTRRRYSNYDPTLTPKQQQERYQSQAREAELDAQSQRKNSMYMQRLQSGLQAVRSGMREMGLTYEWFKIRCGYEYCSSY